jgi:RimJ/RimL family protein N-acetyltransferase
MIHPRIRTPRLDLVPATADILASDLQDRETLRTLLDARVPDAWPPYLMNDEVLRLFIDLATGSRDPYFSDWYWVWDNPGAHDRVLVGNGGIFSASREPDAVVIGYSVLDEFRNRGYATEAVRHLIPEIFSDPGIRRIYATTNPDIPTSIRVLMNCGFVPCESIAGGEGAEEGSLAFVRER